MNKAILAGILAIGTTAVLPTAQAGTHLGQTSASSHVTLVSQFVSSSYNNKCAMASNSKQGLFRIRPDGTKEMNPFVVPIGQYLIITDLEWQARGGLDYPNPLAANMALQLDISLVKSGVSGTGSSVYTSAPIIVDPVDLNALLGATDNLTAGITVAPGTTICPQTFQQSSSSWIAVHLNKLVLHGYLSL